MLVSKRRCATAPSFSCDALPDWAEKTDHDRTCGAVLRVPWEPRELINTLATRQLLEPPAVRNPPEALPDQYLVLNLCRTDETVCSGIDP